MTTRGIRVSPGAAALALVGGLVVLVIGASACSPSTPPSTPPVVKSEAPQPVEPSGTATTATVPATSVPVPLPSANLRRNRKVPVRVYFVRGEYLGVGTARWALPSSVASTAMRRLLDGPNRTERALGLRSEIPKGTRLLTLSISSHGVATVNLSKEFESGGGTLSMTLRLAQVVDTLTQFKTVKRVTFKIEGKSVEYIGGEGIIVAPSVDRTDFESAQPAILLESPFPKWPIESPVRIQGTANVFEAQFVVRITDADGKILAEKPVMATSGTGTRGTFDKQVSYKKPKTTTGTITVYEPSAKDGSETNVVSTPVRF